MCKCEECESLFEEPRKKEICLEAEYGVSDLFPSGTWSYQIIEVCPVCGNENIKEIEVDENEEYE